MKKKSLWIFASCMLLGLTGCGAETEKNTENGITSDSVTEIVQVSEEEETTTEEQSESQVETDNAQTQASDATETITENQALSAIKKYCYANDPDLESKENSDEYTIEWGVTTNEEGQIVVLYRSYTAAEIRYYIEPASGDTYVTELVPGITDEEQRTDESLNVRDYME